MTPSLTFPPAAHWIGSSHPFDLHEVYLCFRSPRDWQLPRQPNKAELWITADSRYKLWINGHFVGRGPARSYPHAQQVDQIDVAAYLKAGKNTLAVMVYQPGYSHFAYVHRGNAGLLANLVCDGESVLTTQSQWRVRRDPSFAELVPRVSIYGSGVEERNMSAVDHWQVPTYDDSQWTPARIVAQAGAYPWTELRARSLPLLVEREQPITLLEARQGEYPAQHASDPHLALRTGWTTAVPRAPTFGTAQGKSAPPLTVTLTAKQSAYYLFDLGRDYTGVCWLEVKKASGQEQIAINYSEKIREGQLVISDPQTYCRVRITDRFRLRPGNQSVESFSLRGGRYLLIQVTGPTGSDFTLQPHMRVVEYPVTITKPLTTDDPTLNSIIQLCENSFHACLQDGFVDSVWRESSQWVGDALPQSLILTAMSDDTRPIRQVIEMAAQGAYPDGLLPSVLPGEVHSYTIPRYGFMWVEMVALYYQLSKDDDFVHSMWPALEKMLELLTLMNLKDGLLHSPAGWRFYVDWSPSSQQQPHAVYNLHAILALQRASQLKQGDWSERVGQLQSATRTAFLQDGVWWDDLPRTTFSQLAAALAILTHTAKPEEESALLDAIIARSLDLDDAPATGKMTLASPFMHHYIFEALRQGGREEAALEIIRRRWGRWVEQGYPTTWENWNVDFPDGSQCHAFSAHPRYHLAKILPQRGKEAKARKE